MEFLGSSSTLPKSSDELIIHSRLTDKSSTKSLGEERDTSSELLAKIPTYIRPTPKETKSCCSKGKVFNVALIIIGIVGAGGLAFGLVGFFVPASTLPSWMAAAFNTVGHGGVIGFTAGGGFFVLVGFGGVINAVRLACKNTKPKELEKPEEEEGLGYSKMDPAAQYYKQLTEDKQFIVITHKPEKKEEMIHISLHPKPVSSILMDEESSEDVLVEEDPTPTYSFYIRHSKDRYEKQENVNLGSYCGIINRLEGYVKVDHQKVTREHFESKEDIFSFPPPSIDHFSKLEKGVNSYIVIPRNSFKPLPEPKFDLYSQSASGARHKDEDINASRVKEIVRDYLKGYKEITEVDSID